MLGGECARSGDPSMPQGDGMGSAVAVAQPVILRGPKNLRRTTGAHNRLAHQRPLTALATLHQPRSSGVTKTSDQPRHPISWRNRMSPSRESLPTCFNMFPPLAVALNSTILQHNIHHPPRHHNHAPHRCAVDVALHVGAGQGRLLQRLLLDVRGHRQRIAQLAVHLHGDGHLRRL